MNPTKRKDPREFVIALYQRPNDSFASKLDCCINGHVGVFVDGQNCIVPRFMVENVKRSYQLAHRPRPNARDEDDTYQTIRVYPTISETEIDDEYQSPEGVMKLLEMSKAESDETSPMYKLRLGTKDLVFGDMGEAERRASEAVAKGPMAIPASADLSQALAEKDAKIEEQDAKIAEQAKKMDEMSAKMDMILNAMSNKAETSSESTSEKAGPFMFNGKEYKTETAMKTAMTKFEKAQAESSESEEDEEEPIEVQA